MKKLDLRGGEGCGELLRELFHSIVVEMNDDGYAVNDYELRGDDGDYSPTENERFLIVDYMTGFLEEFQDRLSDKILKRNVYINV